MRRLSFRTPAKPDALLARTRVSPSAAAVSIASCAVIGTLSFSIAASRGAAASATDRLGPRCVAYAKAASSAVSYDPRYFPWQPDRNLFLPLRDPSSQTPLNPRRLRCDGTISTPRSFALA